MRLRSPYTSPTSDCDGSEGSCNDHSPLETPPVTSTVVAPILPQFPSKLSSTPTPTDEREVSSTSTGKRTLPPEDNKGSDQDSSSPFTPQGREMMQKLCLSSPSPSLSSMSPTPGNSTASARSQLIHTQQLPNVPTFSFSPSLNFEKDHGLFASRRESSKSNTADSSVRETIVFSAGSTPLGTPKRGGPKGSITSASSSPFHSLRGQRTPIGHQRGSVFKTLPARLYPNGREDVASSIASDVNSLQCSSPFTVSSSPRVVPLTVLSRDGSPCGSPNTTSMSSLPYDPSSASHSVGMPSPLMRSLETKDESLVNLLSPMLDVKMPSISKAEESPMSYNSNHLLPKIKLTPRGKNSCFLSAKLNEDTNTSLTLPRLSRPDREEKHTGMIETASSFFADCPGDKEAMEMDSLLDGFEQHKAVHDNEGATEQGTKYDALGRVESEEAEIASLTKGHFQMPSLWLPPAATKEKSNGGRHSTLTLEGDSSNCSQDDLKPMCSITLDLGSGQEDSPSHLPSKSPSFLPRPIPAPTKSRSLFNSSNSQDGPLERILRADAIAEAARSNEPLTDDDSVDGEDSDFLLCLPSQESDNSSKSSKLCQGHFKLHQTGFRADSPSFNWRSESPSFSRPRSGGFIKRSKCSDHSFHSLVSSPTTPTIFEEGLTIAEKSTSKRPFLPVPTHEGLGVDSFNKHEISDASFATFCSLSDCDAFEIMSSPKYSRTKALSANNGRQSVCSLMSSRSSLCGLDIVHETSFNPVLLSSGSSEFAPSFKALPSQLSMNSLGLSVDSADVGTDPRDLFTPPVLAGVRTKMLSPPPLHQHYRSASPQVGISDVSK